MAVIKVKELAYGRLRAPDLDEMEEFLTHFGMSRSARTDDALYMRGTDSAHHIHVTEKGEPGFIGFAYLAEKEEDLALLAATPGASAVEEIDEPGGGKRVLLREPNGYRIEVVHGIGELPAIEVSRGLNNSGAEPLRRAGEVLRLGKSPSPVKRIGHGVLATPKVVETAHWFQDTLGFLCSDDVYVETEDNIIGSFNRCDRGDEFTDHHVLFCIRHERAGLNHLSFEIPDIDAVFMDHEYLSGLGKYEHMWGVGRHLVGSQVFDYWSDPWGHVHERWADTDRLNAAMPPNLLTAEIGLSSQWGDDAPQKFIDRVSP
jgi:catechol 2,3-dioxygenase-like lactoylglutathione lyase family enzyme